MLSYLEQVALCESVRQSITRALNDSEEASLRQQIDHVPFHDSILRAASLAPHTDTEERLKGFVTEHVLKSLHLTPEQKEYLDNAAG